MIKPALNYLLIVAFVFSAAFTSCNSRGSDDAKSLESIIYDDGDMIRFEYDENDRIVKMFYYRDAKNFEDENREGVRLYSRTTVFYLDDGSVKIVRDYVSRWANSEEEHFAIDEKTADKTNWLLQHLLGERFDTETARFIYRGESDTEIVGLELERHDDVSVSGNEVLTPYEIDNFARYMTAAEMELEGGAYDFINDPNGEYYHFIGYVSGGDSQWDGLSYEEEFSASSVLAPQGNTRYDATNLQNNTTFGGSRATTWCEGVEGHGIGERINMRTTTRGDYSEDGTGFSALMIVNGYARNQTTWKNNGRVKILRLYVGDRRWCDLHLRDVIRPQVFIFPEHLLIKPHISGKKVIPAENEQYDEYDRIVNWTYQTDLSFEIVEVYAGDKYEDTCITGIALDAYSGVY